MDGYSGHLFCLKCTKKFDQQYRGIWGTSARKLARGSKIETMSLYSVR